MKMPVAVYVLMAKDTTAMPFFFVICVTWQFTKNAMVFPIYPKASGYADAVFSHPQHMFNAYSVRIVMELLNRLTVVFGHMSFVQFGSLKFILLIR